MDLGSESSIRACSGTNQSPYLKERHHQCGLPKERERGKEREGRKDADYIPCSGR